ncbi:phosphonate ABC transporter, permease protein PhnE [Halorubrum gandharaense]
MSGDDATTIDADDADDANRIEERFERIKHSRRIRAVGAVVLLFAIGFMFVQALSAVSIFDEGYQWGFFGESLSDFFPITMYFGFLPFLDFGAYWTFISENSLIFDAGDASTLVTDPIGFVFDGSLGIFSIFGEAGVTLAMGFAGTILGFPLALLFGVLGSERVTPFPFNFIFRGTMSSIRAIPALVWALIFVPLAGLGPATATLAIATDTIGNLGRLFTDELEEIEEGPIEAMRTTGANKPQIIVFGMLSQVTTPFIAWTLYIFEINVRIAVSLGIIGAGGLGQVLDVQQGLFQFTNMMATILVILVLIISVEMVSQRTRAHLRADTESKGFIEMVRGFPQRMAESLFK